MEKNKSERSIGWLVEEIMKGSVEKNRNRQEQELIRRGEFRDRTERLVRNLMVEELDRAREEGFRIMFEGLDNIARNSSEDFYKGVAIIKLRNEITRLYKLKTKEDGK